jgi:multimeric flavodoxin WrbA
MKDGLSACLDEISKCDVLLLGSPIYIGGITGVMHSFLERLLFAPLVYDADYSSIFPGRVASCFFYTLGAPEERAKAQNYQAIFQSNDMGLKRLKGASEHLVSYNTYQFDDYAKYDAPAFDEKAKAKHKAEHFPEECRKAFDIGARLAQAANE